MLEATTTVFEEQGEKEGKLNEKELDEPEVERAGPRCESEEKERLKGILKSCSRGFPWWSNE